MSADDENNSLSLRLEALIFAADKPLSLDRMQELLALDASISKADLRKALTQLTEDYTARGIELVEVASGFRFQTRQEYADVVGRLWEEKPQRYSRALLETLALIAYRQPITRGDIEEIRGVAVSSNIMKTLMERNWIRIVGHREVPGRPAIYATTRQFLDYFNLKSLDQLPSLAEIRDLDTIAKELTAEFDFEKDVNQQETEEGEVPGMTEHARQEGLDSAEIRATSADSKDASATGIPLSLH